MLVVKPRMKRRCKLADGKSLWTRTMPLTGTLSLKLIHCNDGVPQTPTMETDANPTDMPIVRVWSADEHLMTEVLRLNLENDLLRCKDSLSRRHTFNATVSRLGLQEMYKNQRRVKAKKDTGKAVEQVNIFDNPHQPS